MLPVLLFCRGGCNPVIAGFVASAAAAVAGVSAVDGCNCLVSCRYYKTVAGLAGAAAPSAVGDAAVATDVRTADVATAAVFARLQMVAATATVMLITVAVDLQGCLYCNCQSCCCCLNCLMLMLSVAAST